MMLIIQLILSRIITQMGPEHGCMETALISVQPQITVRDVMCVFFWFSSHFLILKTKAQSFRDEVRCFPRVLLSNLYVVS